FLEKEEQQNYRQQDKQRACHQIIPLCVHLAFENLQPDLQGIEIFIVQIQERSQEVVPGTIERKNRHCCNRWFCQRQSNFPPDIKVIGAFHFGSFDQLVWNGHV